MNPMISQDDIDAFSESPPSKLSENQKHYLDKKCAEVAQEASKLIRFPENDTEKLVKELGDLQCMINLTANHLGIDPIQIGVQVNNKRDKLHKYSNLFSK